MNHIFMYLKREHIIDSGNERQFGWTGRNEEDGFEKGGKEAIWPEADARIRTPEY